jgi:TonB family protein
MSIPEFIKPLVVFIALALISFTAFSQSQRKDTYTYDAIENNIEGKVYISFVIDLNGNIIPDSVKVLRGLGYGLDEVAINAIKSAPKWTGVGKNVKFTIPIAFSLSDVDDKAWSDYYTTKAGKCMDVSKWDDAITYYKQAIDKNKKNPDPYYQLSKAYTAKKDTSNAKIYLDKAIKKGYKNNL